MTYQIPESILDEIKTEREYQVTRWGNAADDTKNTPNDFVTYISHHATRWFNGGFAPYGKTAMDIYRKQMIKTATLAIAAIESLDRQRAEKGTAFFENSNP